MFHCIPQIYAGIILYFCPIANQIEKLSFLILLKIHLLPRERASIHLSLGSGGELLTPLSGPATMFPLRVETRDTRRRATDDRTTAPEAYLAMTPEVGRATAPEDVRSKGCSGPSGVSNNVGDITKEKSGCTKFTSLVIILAGEAQK